MGRMFGLGIVVGVIGLIVAVYLWIVFSERLPSAKSDDIPYSKYFEETNKRDKKILQLENKLKAQEVKEKDVASDCNARIQDKENELEILRGKLTRIAELCPGYEMVFSPDFKGRMEVVSGEDKVLLPVTKSEERATHNGYYLFDRETKRVVRSGLRVVIAENTSVRALYDSVMDGRLRNAFQTELSIRKIDVTAEIKSTEKSYTVTPCSCTCPDFEKRQKPCKHMLFLAYSLGVLQAYPEHIDESLEKLARIPRRDRFGRYD